MRERERTSTIHQACSPQNTESFQTLVVHRGTQLLRSSSRKTKHREPTKVRLSFRLDLKMLPKNSRWWFLLLSRALFARNTLTKCSFLITGSRYIYDLYYEKEAISKQLYDWLLKNNYADAMLIAKWKKQGYEKVSGAAERKGKYVFKIRLLILAFEQ